MIVLGYNNFSFSNENPIGVICFGIENVDVSKTKFERFTYDT